MVLWVLKNVENSIGYGVLYNSFIVNLLVKMKSLSSKFYSIFTIYHNG